VDRVKVLLVELELLGIILWAVRVDRNVVEEIDVFVVVEFGAAADQVCIINWGWDLDGFRSPGIAVA